MRRSVVVTGMGVVAPLRPFMGMDAFWNALCSGEDAVKMSAAPLLDTGMQWPMARIDQPGRRWSLRPEDKLIAIAEEALKMAMEDAGLQAACGEPRHTGAGLVVGTILGNVLLKERRLMQRDGPQAFSRDEELVSFAADYLGKRNGFRGPTLTISTACASGTDAIGVAARKVAEGKCEVMVAGGVDVLSDFALLGFHALKALTMEKVRPFDRNRTGLALGEGAAFVVLEAEGHAQKRGAKAYGRIRGYASRADANHLTGPHKEGRGLADAARQAMAEAGLTPGDIDYINAHGTGTVYNDLMETKVVKNIFGDHALSVPVSSIKSMIGHSFGAAGAIEVICCMLAIRGKIIPPTINFSERDPECDLDYVPNIARRRDVKVAASMSAGFGGQNSVVIVGET